MKKTQTRCRRDAGLTQCRRKADAEQTQRDAVRPQSRSAQKHGRRRDADGSISYSLAHMIFIAFGSLIA